MGFSVSGSAAIIFIAAFVSVGIVYTAAYNGYEAVSTAEDRQADRLLDRENTEVVITGMAYNSNDDEFTVELLNDGSTTLEISATDVLLDGVYKQSWVSSQVVGASTPTDLWAPGETLFITVQTGTAPSRVKIVTEHGVSVTEVL